MAHYLQALIDEIDNLHDGDGNRITPLAKSLPPPAKPAPKHSFADLCKSINELGMEFYKSHQRKLKAKADKAAAILKMETDKIAARNATRNTVSTVLAKALELNRLGLMSAAEVARVEMTANDVLARLK